MTMSLLHVSPAWVLSWRGTRRPNVGQTARLPRDDIDSTATDCCGAASRRPAGRPRVIITLRVRAARQVDLLTKRVISTVAVRADRGTNLQEQIRDKLSPQEKKLLRRFAKERQTTKSPASSGCRPGPAAAQRQRIVEKLEIRSQAQLASAAHLFAYWGRKQADAKNKKARR